MIIFYQIDGFCHLLFLRGDIMDWVDYLDRQMKEAQERNDDGFKELGKEFEGVIIGNV